LQPLAAAALRNSVWIVHQVVKAIDAGSVSTAATGVIGGLGPQGYIATIDAIAAMPVACG
jgi:3-dehydroquinate dehydratase